MNRAIWCSLAICISGLLSACGGGGGYGNNGGGGGSHPTATHFSVTAPQDVKTGSPFSFIVTALDATNAVAASYTGTVDFTSSDHQAVLPANSTLADGTGTFTATFETVGSQTIAATDAATKSITGMSTAIQVSSPVVNGAFTDAGSMDIARVGHTATLLLDGKVLITGGENSAGALASAEIYDPVSGVFTPTGNMGVPRVWHAATLLHDGTVLITGGQNSTGTLAAVELFDPASGTFSPRNSMATPREGHSATLLQDGRVLVTGGGGMQTDFFVPLAGGGTTSAELFDPNSGNFAAAGDMLQGRVFHTATLLPNGNVLLAGGTATFFASGSDAGDLYNPSTNTFMATPAGGSDGLLLASALLNDGSVLIAGGESSASPCGMGGNWVVSAAAILFNSGATTFAQTGAMSIGRLSHTATLLPGGHVLIAGGATINTSCDRGFGTSTFPMLDSAELFDPHSGTFSPTGSLQTARAGHTATRLSNGQVLVLGGVDAKGAALASAELFQ